MKSRSNIEAAIQRAGVDWVKKTHADVKIIATLNENSRHHIGMGCDVGITDLMLMKRVGGVLYVFFLELKKKKGVLSKSQKDWRIDYECRFAGNNTRYDVAYGFDEMKEKINLWIKSLDH